MKKNYLLFCYLFFIFNSCFCQPGTWTWISGDSAINAAGIYGIQGTPSGNNHPPAIYDAVEWKDKGGNFWIYGGTSPMNCDLWKFNPATREWTWVKGNKLLNISPIYGLKGVANVANTPGQRSYTAATWVDTSGALWLMGGAGCGDDLWKYDIGTNEWTWMAGDTIVNSSSFHGTYRTASSLTTPGNRYSTCSAWTDSLNNLWLFGGFGFDDNNDGGGYEDLWKYSINNGEWTWMKGAAYTDSLPEYGIKGVDNASNEPGGRFSYTKWKDLQGNLWIMGGLDYDLIHLGLENDMWKYDMRTGNWTWISGPDSLDGEGTYQSTCAFDAANVPDSREYQRSSATDNCGRFWMFGGFANDSNLNDLWVYDPQYLKWNLMRGSRSQPSHYGNKGVASLSNMPHTRGGAVAWWGDDNKFYLFGGQGDDQSSLYADMWVFDPDTNCIPMCSAVVGVSPVANFESSDSTICTNDCIDFTNMGSNATSWQWSFIGGNPATSTAENPHGICYALPGNYSVKLVATNGVGMDSISLNNFIHVTSPPTPTITQAGAILYCSTNPAYSSYQWYDSATVIPGATDTFLVVSHGGNYNIGITDINGCKTGAGLTIILGEQLLMVNDLLFTVSPNPVTNILTINNSGLGQNENYLVSIYNLLGEEIYAAEFNYKLAAISCTGFTSGVYFIQVANKTGRATGKFVKE